MKARMYDLVRSLVPVQSDFGSPRIIPAGSTGTVVYCYDEPEAYAVDLEIPNLARSSGRDFENVVLTPDQFEVVERHVPRPGEMDDTDRG